LAAKCIKNSNVWDEERDTIPFARKWQWGKRGWGKRGWGEGGGGAGKDLLDFRGDSLEFFNTKQARIWKHTPILAFTVCTVYRGRRTV
jgi:hypothetical protein